ncbi:hypothetical protein JHK86_040651 [Glycine max]|nr:hypothetical protein JHK86_040651 [Glycine max]
MCRLDNAVRFFFNFTFSFPLSFFPKNHALHGSLSNSSLKSLAYARGKLSDTF